MYENQTRAFEKYEKKTYLDRCRPDFVVNQVAVRVVQECLQTQEILRHR